PDVTRMYYNAKYDTDHGPIDYDDLPDYILRRYIGLTSQEHVLLILLDTKGREVFSGFISDGNFEATRFSVRSIVRLAMNYGAKMAILAHNHPSGVALPSKEDLNTTVYLREALSLVDVDLIDHFIVANEECISLAQSGWM
ncbi:MAG: JAB domain-containing protein, partial [Ruminococcus sp.]|nr:JAB domain-containing protein [Ruminococcus sp.]